MGRRPRRRKVLTDSSDHLPGYLLAKLKMKMASNIAPEDLVWIGEDGKLDPDKLLQERGYESESALRLILGAIIDAHMLVDGPSRSSRIDSAEEALLGEAQKRGKDPYDDEDMLGELGRRYFRRWQEDSEHEIEVGPITRELLAEARAANRDKEYSDEATVRRLQRKFARRSRSHFGSRHCRTEMGLTRIPSSNSSDP